MSVNLYDAHCHIFNVWYLVDETLARWCDPHYPYPPKDTTGEGTAEPGAPGTPGEKDEFWKWFTQVLESAFGSEEDNMKLLQTAAGKTWPDLIPKGDILGIIPLMMDIYYMYAYELGDNEVLTATAGYINPRFKSIKEYVDTIKPASDPEQKRLDLLNKHLKNSGSHTTETQPSEQIHWTLGYKNNYDTLSALEKKKNANLKYAERMIYPFIAIDPRRPGIIEALLAGELIQAPQIEGEIISREGPFYGVKLYPRLGYHPNCVPLQGIYEYCQRKRIPITTHTSFPGFPDSSWYDKQYKGHEEFGNPACFSKILEESMQRTLHDSKTYPPLHIDFAHFGCDPDLKNGNWKEWADKIVEYIGQYPGVFSDFSCYTTDDEMEYFKDNIWRDTIVNRTMFGTDFDVMFYTNIGKIDLKDYFHKFYKKSYDKNEIITMSSTIPKKFLFIEPL